MCAANVHHSSSCGTEGADVQTARARQRMVDARLCADNTRTHGEDIREVARWTWGD